MQAKRPKNARFTVWVNGSEARITLKPGQTLSHEQGGPTEEGWSSSYEQWSYDEIGLWLTREYGSDGVDCDGRLSSYGEDCCRARNLKSNGFPRWERVDSGQRDYAAEAAGY